MRGPLRLAALLVLTAAASAQEPYGRLLERPAGFHGPAAAAADPAAVGEVRLGLFAPPAADGGVAGDLARGAGLAVERANAGGGLAGVPFRLVRRWAADPWGAGSREVARLVYGDRVWALIGGPDGASTHVAEQLATKAWVPMVAPLASDPSLTRAGVPWLFRLPPGDDLQAVALAGAMAARGLHRPALVTGVDHDSRVAAAELVPALERELRAPVLHLTVDPRLPDPAAAAARVAAAVPDVVVLRLPPPAAIALAGALREAGLRVPLLVPWVPGLEPAALAAAAAGPVVAVRPAPPAAAFQAAYRQRWGTEATAAAAYGYDAVTLIVAGLRTGGLSRADLRERLAAASGTAGASGLIGWDAGGGSTTEPVVVEYPALAPPGAGSGR